MCLLLIFILSGSFLHEKKILEKNKSTVCLSPEMGKK